MLILISKRCDGDVSKDNKYHCHHITPLIYSICVAKAALRKSNVKSFEVWQWKYNCCDETTSS